MASPRQNSRFTFVAFVSVLLLALGQQKGAQSTSDLPAFPPAPFLLPGWDEDKELHRLKWSEAIRSSLKRNQDPAASDLVQYFTEEQVDAATKSEYKIVPHPIIYTSQILHKGVNCSTINVDLHKNHVKPELQLRPNWIHKSEFIGDCPTNYVARELPPMYSPTVILEAVCACGGSQCSRRGHQCVPVSSRVPVWVRRGPNFLVLDVEELTVACACVRRPSGEGNFIFEAAVQS
ncbi:uncharacterized protein [Macrobrachium rosenbergii]|uniref:uncharacterized protein n=1 Tax=Macrobrachium rosenbergii TaxID=79674 RepID=UPI0034D7B960